MKKILVALALGMAMITGTCAVAQDKAAGVTDLQALRAAVKTDKRAFVAATLGLTDAEAAGIAIAAPLHGRDRLLALMDLGATVCLARVPRCDACPLAEHCPSRGRRYEPLRRQGPFEGSFRQRRARFPTFCILADKSARRGDHGNRLFP